MSALRGSDSASPPLNMHRSLIFLGIFIGVVVASVSVLRGRQVRRETDVLMLQGGGPSQNDETRPATPGEVEENSLLKPA